MQLCISIRNGRHLINDGYSIYFKNFILTSVPSGKRTRTCRVAHRGGGGDWKYTGAPNSLTDLWTRFRWSNLAEHFSLLERKPALILFEDLHEWTPSTLPTNTAQRHCRWYTMTYEQTYLSKTPVTSWEDFTTPTSISNVLQINDVIQKHRPSAMPLWSVKNGVRSQAFRPDEEIRTVLTVRRHTVLSPHRWQRYKRQPCTVRKCVSNYHKCETNADLLEMQSELSYINSTNTFDSTSCECKNNLPTQPPAQKQIVPTMEATSAATWSSWGSQLNGTL